MEETSIYVNNKLKEGYSIAKVERELNFGKDTLRKKLNRANYKYNKTLNQFILDDNTNITQYITHAEKDILEKPKSNENEINTDIGYTENNVITNSITHKTTHSKIGKNTDSEIENNITQNITHTEKPCITQSNNTDITQPSSPRAFTDEDFNILFAVIDSYKSKQKNIVISKADSEITTRSFRSYKSVFDSFSEYCKSNNLNQKDAVAEALMLYVSR
jgi:hypothetical protein